MRLFILALPLLLALPVAAQHGGSPKTKAVPAAKPVTVPAPVAHSPQVLDQQYGFRGVKLEADSTSLSALAFERRDNDLFYYHRDTDSLTWAKAAVSGPSYAFYRGKLLSLSFTTKGAANSHAVLARLQDLYGPGEQKGTQQRFTWRGERTLLRYEESSTSNNAVVTLTSLPLTIRRQQDVSGVIEQTAANR
ncbi:hypothetical protein [Hymenobacter sp. CRA2]|uniref:hypothetical protein n=1 Tax=Hymenobacter sp. CRA2 TaxID=1955620 RepID=UPI00098FAEDA|nr:hypothetical protein [Hymenobacter sp. CRA2]OON68506.1 hypothetical protein B0919_12740 [Hymenobacter sp. CRA2]